MAAEAEEAERKALFLLNSVGKDVKIKALDMLRAISGGQTPVRPGRRDGEQVYFNRHGEVEIETTLYLGPNDHRTARKIGYARQVIPMLPFELAWYGHREGMPEPLDRRGNPVAQRRAHAPSTLQIDGDDDEDKSDSSFEVQRRRRRRRGFSSTSKSSDSPVSSLKQSKPSPPKSKNAGKISTLDGEPSAPRQQLRSRPSQMWDPREVDEEIRRDLTRRLEKERVEAEVGFLVPTTMGQEHRSTEGSRNLELSNAVTSSKPETEAEQIQGIAPTPIFRAPIANMGTFQSSGTTQVQGKRVKMYAHKSASNIRPQISASKGPAATEASPHRAAAGSMGRGHIHKSSSHPSAAQTDRALTSSAGSTPIKAGRKQNASRAAKKSVVSQRREEVSLLEEEPKSPKNASDEELIFLPGLRDLIDLDGDEEEDDEDDRIYGHGDGKLRTTAARSSHQRRKRISSSPSASQSPQKKRSKKPSDEVIRAALRPANQPPPKLQFSPGQVKKLGLEGVAKLEKGKVDRAFDKNAPGYSEHGRYSRYINRTDWKGPQPTRTAYPEHMTRGDFYYPEEVPKMKQSTPPPPPPPPRQPRQQQQQRARPPHAPRHQQQQQRVQRGSTAPTPPRRHHQHQPRGASAAYQRPREQIVISDDEGVLASDGAPPQATPRAQTPTPRGRPGWVSGEWMEIAYDMADEGHLTKLLKKKD